MGFTSHKKNAAQNERGIVVRFRDHRSIEYTDGERTLVVPRESADLPNGDYVNYLYLYLPLKWVLPSGDSLVSPQDLVAVKANLVEGLAVLGSKVEFVEKGNG